MKWVELLGLDRIGRRFETAGAALGGRLEPAASRIGARLEGRVHDRLGGAVLHRRSGRLDAAQSTVVEVTPGAVSVSVGFDRRAVPYGAIQEYGGTTRAHLIAARSALALAFTVGDTLVFAKRVNHPGSRIPARSFLRSALAEEGDDASGDINDAVMGALEA